MTAETGTPSPRQRAPGLWSSLPRLISAWLFATWFIAWTQLQWRGGAVEVYVHIRGAPELALAAAVAVILGWVAATPAPFSKEGTRAEQRDQTFALLVLTIVSVMAWVVLSNL